MKISWANRRTAKRWVNKGVSWGDILERLRTPVRTTETVAEFAHMDKAKREATKDVGGFVGGWLREGIRRNGYVVCRSVLTLDADFATPDFWDGLALTFGGRCCVYSTHSHTPKTPRFRLVIPLSREVSEAEYPAIARAVAQDIGIDMFDDTTYEPCRLMYWPSVSSDGKYVFEEQDGDLLDPDEYLARYDDWRDVTQWPTSSRQSEIIERPTKKLADPRKKPGLVGAFCRAYSVQDAITEFLTDVYAPNPVREDRYDYLLGKTLAGLAVYEGGLHAYSHHDSDPAHGRCLNAFDLVRIHKFPEDDEKSNRAMLTLAAEDDKVKEAVLNKDDGPAIHASELLEDYGDNAAEKPKKRKKEKIILDVDRKGNVVNRTSNFAKIIEGDAAFQNVKYNVFTHDYEVCGRVPWKRKKKTSWTDADDHQAQKYIEQKYEIWGCDKFRAAFISVTQNLRRYHPIKDYLNNAEWDGTPRVDTLLADCLGAEDTAYVRAVTRKTLTAAVARIFEPGIKFDNLLVLHGPQGIGKSKIFERLGGEWYSDALVMTDLRNDSKTAPEKIQGLWISEIGEMTGIKKVDAESIKVFLSRQEDRYRPAYGRYVEKHPRSCIIVGTTNAESGFLRDITGNRRFWPVKVTGGKASPPWTLDANTIEQIWAEAVTYYEKREKLYMDDKTLLAEAEKQQRGALEADDREGLISDYLERTLPDNWANTNLYERRGFLESDKEGTEARISVCPMEIWCECLNKNGEDIRKIDSYEIAAILRRLGWTFDKVIRLKNYGTQRVYIRDEREDHDELLT